MLNYYRPPQPPPHLAFDDWNLKNGTKKLELHRYDMSRIDVGGYGIRFSDLAKGEIMY